MSTWAPGRFQHCKPELRACVLLTVLLALLSLVPALTVGIIIDQVIQTRAYATLAAVLMVYVLFFVCEAAFTWVHDRLMLHITHSAMVQAEARFWQILGAAPFIELERLNQDDGLARFLSIGTDVRFRADWAVCMASIPLSLSIALVALCLVSPIVAILLTLATAVFVIAHVLTTRMQRHAAREMQRTRERELSCIDELFRGVLSLKAHRAFDFGLRRWHASKQDCEVALHRWSTASVIQSLTGLSFERLSLGIVLGVGSYEVVTGQLSVGQLVMANMLLRQVSMQVRQIAPLLQRYTAFGVSQEQMEAFLSRKQRKPEPVTVQQMTADASVVADGLSFRAPDGRLILDNISFELPRGKSLAILGASGSGKSTLLKILSGLYPPSSGAVLVEGLPPTAHSNLVYLSQQEHLFSDGVTENVMLGRAAPPDLTHTLHCLDLSRVIAEKARNGEAVGPLSGGERQRIFVARAVTPSAAGLLLDEPTTALDDERRAAMVDLLRAAARERSVMIFATHDSVLADIADYTLHLVHGRIGHLSARSQSMNPAQAGAMH